MRTLLLGLGLVALLLAAAPAAFAQTGGTAAENFSCSDGRASGELYNSNPSCPTTLSFDHIFSYFICNMEQLSSNLMGSMYCGMVSSLTPMVMAVLSIAVMVFGFGFTIGIIPATAREFQKFLLKVGLVAVFATQSEYLIGYGYRFLVEGSREGITIALSGLYTPPEGSAAASNTGATMYAQLDGFLAHVLHFATDYMGAKWNGGTNPCQNAIFAVLAIMAVAFPPLFYLSLLIIVKIAITFLRAVFGYVYSIIGIAFLLALAPFFLSFYLFTVTRSYFDKWLGYLISFSLQMVVVFAFLTFIVSIDVKSLSSSLVNIIVPVQETQETTSYRLPWKYCTLCEFEVVVTDEQGNERVLPDDEYQGYLGQGELRCKDNPNYDSTATSGPNSVNYVPIRALSAISPPSPGGSGGATPAPDRSVQSALLKFASTALLSLLVLAYIIDGILRFVPYFAQKIAGGLAPYAPQLGGGVSPSGVATVDIPGVRYDGASQRYEGVFGSFERGFNAGFTQSNSNSISRTVAGVRQGFSTVRDGSGASGDPSMSQRFINYLTNPLGGTSRD